MSIVNNIRLVIKYPFLLPRNRWNDKVTNWDWVWSNLKVGKIKAALKYIYHFEYTELDSMPEGWRKVFGEQMCEDIKQELIRCSKIMGVNKNILLKEYRILEIKEKYGTLRWYDNGSPIMSKIDDIIKYYEDLSMCYCLRCGKPVRYKTSGWIEYLCPECFSNYADKITGEDLKEYKNKHRVSEKDIPIHRKLVLTVKGDNRDDITEEWPEYTTGVDFRKLWGLKDEV